MTRASEFSQTAPGLIYLIEFNRGSPLYRDHTGRAVDTESEYEPAQLADVFLSAEAALAVAQRSVRAWAPDVRWVEASGVGPFGNHYGYPVVGDEATARVWVCRILRLVVCTDVEAWLRRHP